MRHKVSKPLVLLLKGHECNVARVTAYIRLGSSSAAGIIFRAKSQADYFEAALDADKRVRISAPRAEGQPLSTIYL